MSDTEALLITLISCCLPLLCAGSIGGGIVYLIMSSKKKKREEEAYLIDSPAEEITQEKAIEKRMPAKVKSPKKEISSFPPGSVGAVSQQLGYDVRDARMAGLDLADMVPLSKNELAYTEKEMKRLVYGLWADEDPNEKDYDDARKAAKAYRKSCAKKLRKVGKDAIPYLESHADREEALALLDELKKI